MEYKQNEQLRLAAEFVSQTNLNIFLTGRAGTGKTTFLRNLNQITPKRMVVVAPTGVAAINAGGVTIHSFFQLNFSPFVPLAGGESAREKQQESYMKKFNRNKIKLIKCIDLLVIDEVSMVRADVLDAVDEVLRRYRNRSKPFGGVQLLMIGDLYQLCPVIRDEDWHMLKTYYQSVFFFDSLALRKNPAVTIELTEIFRQRDAGFIALLNRVRENNMDPASIAAMNARYIPGFNPPDEEGYINLTTHNASANGINQSKLGQLKGHPESFSAVIKGEFPPHDFPTDVELVLKVNAQVMFIKNDLAQEKAYYNGKIGIVTRMTDESVYVRCPGDPSDIAAGRVTWENIRYTLNETTREIGEEIIGTFEQIPLKLAWAITIHKSQGLTFSKVIIDAQAAFASGQVYVALSRCRTFEGIVLSTPIKPSGIKTDSTVLGYSREARQQEPGPDRLRESKHAYQAELILELFDLHSLDYRFENLLKTCREHLGKEDRAITEAIAVRKQDFSGVLIPVARKFRGQLSTLLANAELPAENTLLQERIGKAVSYFTGQLNGVNQFLKETVFDTDNKANQKALNESLEKLQKEVFIKLTCLEATRNGFATLALLRAKSDAELDFRPPAKTKIRTQPGLPHEILHPELFQLLKEWRKKVADEQHVPVFRILPQKSIHELVQKLPTNTTRLKSITGIGPAKLKQYGSEILSLIMEYISKEHSK